MAVRSTRKDTFIFNVCTITQGGTYDTCTSYSVCCYFGISYHVYQLRQERYLFLSTFPTYSCGAYIAYDNKRVLVKCITYFTHPPNGLVRTNHPRGYSCVLLSTCILSTLSMKYLSYVNYYTRNVPDKNKNSRTQLYMCTYFFFF